MKNNLNLVLIILILSVLGCVCPSPREKSYKEAYNYGTPQPATPRATTSQPTPNVKNAQIDIPKLVGKSQSEIISILGKPKRTTQLNKTDKTGEVSFDYDYSGGEYWINFKNGKADYFHIPAKNAYKTGEEFGDIVGLNLRDVYPSTRNAVVDAYSGVVNGVDWYKITVNKSEEGYTILTAQKTP